jgi:rubrerythrin
MTHHDVNAEKQTGTTDVTYNLVSILYHALQGGENYAVYARDAEAAGERDLAAFFEELVQQERARADRAKQLLKDRL